MTRILNIDRHDYRVPIEDGHVVDPVPFGRITSHFAARTCRTNAVRSDAPWLDVLTGNSASDLFGLLSACAREITVDISIQGKYNAVAPIPPACTPPDCPIPLSSLMPLSGPRWRGFGWGCSGGEVPVCRERELFRAEERKEGRNGPWTSVGCDCDEREHANIG